MKATPHGQEYQCSWTSEEEVLKSNIMEHIEKANKKELRSIMEFILKGECRGGFDRSSE